MKTSAKTMAKLEAIKSLQGTREFNQWARDAYAARDTEALMLAAWNLAERQLSYRRGPKAKAFERAPATRTLCDVLLQVGATAGVKAALDWKKGNFYKS